MCCKLREGADDLEDAAVYLGYSTDEYDDYADNAPTATATWPR